MSFSIRDIASNADLFVRLIERRWVREKVYALVNILAKHGVTEGKVLDLLCGDGVLSLNLAKFGFNVVGFDVYEKVINIAKEKARSANISGKTHFYVGDLRELLIILEREAPFDAIINIGLSTTYYNDDADLEIFSSIAKLTRKDGLFLIIDGVNRDQVIKSFREIDFDELERLVVIRRNEFELRSSKLISRLEIFERAGRDLKFITEFRVEQRLYSFHELLRVLSKAGWEFIEAYHDILTGEEFRFDSPFNIIAKRI